MSVTTSFATNDVGLTDRMRRRQKRQGWLIDQSGNRQTTLHRKIGLEINQQNTVAILTEQTAPGVIWILRTFVIRASAAHALDDAMYKIRTGRERRADAEDLIVTVLNNHGIELPIGALSPIDTRLPYPGDLSVNLSPEGRDQFIEDENQRAQARRDQICLMATPAASRALDLGPATTAIPTNREEENTWDASTK